MKGERRGAKESKGKLRSAKGSKAEQSREKRSKVCSNSIFVALLCSSLLSLFLLCSPSLSFAVLCSPLLSLALACSPLFYFCCLLHDFALLRSLPLLSALFCFLWLSSSSLCLHCLSFFILRFPLREQEPQGAPRGAVRGAAGRNSNKMQQIKKSPWAANKHSIQTQTKNSNKQ